MAGEVPKARLDLQGQDSDEAKELVAAQRSLKKKKDALRKLMSKVKNTSDTTKEAIEQEIRDVEAEVAALESIVNSVAQCEVSESAAEAAEASTKVNPREEASGGSVPVSSDAPKVRLDLQGQDSEEARELVASQRELKKKKDALRKASSKLKNATTDSDKDLAKADVAQLEADIARLEQLASGGVAASTTPNAPVQVVCAPKSDVGNELSSALSAPKSKPPPAVHIPQDVVGSLGPLLQLLRCGQWRQSPSSALNAASSTPVTNKELVYPKPLVGSLLSTPGGSALPTPSATPSRQSAVFKQQPPTTQVSPHVVSAGGDGSGTRFAEPSRYSSIIHPRAAELGLLMQSMKIVGSNARTVALLDTFKEITRTTPLLNVPMFTVKERKAFENLVQENFRFLCSCREPCAGMTFVKKAFARRVSAIAVNSHPGRGATMPDRTASAGSQVFDTPSSPLTSAPTAFHSRSLPASSSRFPVDPLVIVQPLDATAVSLSDECPNDESIVGAVGVREHIVSIIEEIKEEIFRSLHSLVEERAQAHIASDDCILTFGRSSCVELVLRHAVALHKTFRVIVVDSGPLYEGRSFAVRLQRLGIPVTYALITSVCTLLPKCTKVFLGASAVLQSGEVYSRAGTAMVASCAKSFRKPVLCMCESHKFVPKVWIGSLVQNSEIGDIQQRRPMGLFSQGIPLSTDDAAADRNDPNGYLYDLTPAACVDMVVCEMGCLHTSAVAAAIRDRQDREILHWQ